MSSFEASHSPAAKQFPETSERIQYGYLTDVCMLIELFGEQFPEQVYTIEYGAIEGAWDEIFKKISAFIISEHNDSKVLLVDIPQKIDELDVERKAKLHELLLTTDPNIAVLVYHNNCIPHAQKEEDLVNELKPLDKVWFDSLDGVHDALNKLENLPINLHVKIIDFSDTIKAKGTLDDAWNEIHRDGFKYAVQFSGIPFICLMVPQKCEDMSVEHKKIFDEVVEEFYKYIPNVCFIHNNYNF